MKRFKKIFLVFTLLLVAMSFFNVKGNVKADENLEVIVLEGCGKVETTADCCILNFNINVAEKEFDEGQKKINEMFNSISQQIMAINEENLSYITYTSCYPEYKEDFIIYEFSCSFSVKTKKVDSVQEIVNEVSKNGAVSYYGCEYCLNDTKQVYNDALMLAKEDAIDKARTLNSCVELKAIVGSHIYSYSSNDNLGKIIIEAKVKGVFVCGEENKSEQNNIKNASKENISKNAFC